MLLQASRFFNTIHEPLFEALFQGLDGCLILLLVELPVLVLVEKLGDEVISIIDHAVTIQIVTYVRYPSLLAFSHHNRFGPSLEALGALAGRAHVDHGGPPVRHLCRVEKKLTLTNFLFQDVAVIGLTRVHCLLFRHACDIVAQGVVAGGVKQLLGGSRRSRYAEFLLRDLKAVSASEEIHSRVGSAA